MARLMLRLLAPLHTYVNVNILLQRNSSRCNPLSLQPEVEAGFNRQINHELIAGYNYLAMETFFGKQSVNLQGCREFYSQQVKEEEKHAKKLIDYVNSRGGCVVLQPVVPSEHQQWSTPICVFKEALELEKMITEKLFELHEITTRCKDLGAAHMLEGDFINEQVESIDKLSRCIARLEMLGSDGLAIHIFDRWLQRESSIRS